MELTICGECILLFKSFNYVDGRVNCFPTEQGKPLSVMADWSLVQSIVPLETRIDLSGLGVPF